MKINKRSRKKSTLCEKIAKNNIVEEKKLSKRKYSKLLKYHLRNVDKSLKRKLMKDPDIVNVREMNFIKTCKLHHKFDSKKDKSDDYDKIKSNILLLVYLLKLQTGSHNYQ